MYSTLRLLVALFLFTTVSFVLSQAAKADADWLMSTKELKSRKMQRIVKNRRKLNAAKGFSRAGVPITVEQTDIASCPAAGSIGCDWLQDPCYKNCDGLQVGNYKSCVGCDVYLACADGGIPYVMHCPVGLHWNNNAKMCDWPSSAGCVPCLESSTWSVDFENGDIPDGKLSFAWESRPLPASYPECDAPAVIKITPSACAKVVFIHMKIFYLGGPLFHLAGNRLADGMGDYYYGYNFGPDDWEIHSNFKQFLAFTSMSGGYQYHVDETATPPTGQYLDLCIQIKAGEVQVKGGPNVKLTHEHLFADLNKIYIAANRNLAGPDIWYSRGLCSIRVDWSC